MRQLDRRKQGVLCFLIAGTLWGTTGVFVRQLEQAGSTSAETAFFRLALAALFLLPAVIKTEGVRSLLVDKKTFCGCMLLGFVCHGMHNIFYNYAILTVGMSLSAILLNTAPVFTLLFSAVLFRERVTLRKCIAIPLCIAGCILTVTNGSLSALQEPLAGVVYGIGAGFCYGMTAIISKPLYRSAKPLTVSFYSFLGASVMLLPRMLMQDGSLVFSTEILFSRILFALFPTALAYTLFFLGVERIRESSLSNVIASVETVVAVLIGSILYMETMNLLTLSGMLLVMLSVIIISGGAPGEGNLRDNGKILRPVLRKESS